jgi:ERCC4-related helicase
MKITDYHAKYFAHELTRRVSSDSIEKLTWSLSDAQVDLNPHQVDAALFAFRSPLSKGAILADEVGLGKTIEAGIVLTQKWAERKRRILIIVPSNLRKQWSQELSDKFFLPSVILESKSFNSEISNSNLNPFVQDKIIICSYHFARSKEPYIKLIDWDLVVIDEAHRLRNVYKPSNKIANSIKQSIKQSPKILLTATPLHNSLLELYGLVSIIDEYTFGDLKSFKEQFGRLTSEDDFAELKVRLKPVCQRTLRKQVLEYVRFTNRIPITQEFFPSEEEQRLYDLVSNYLQKDNLYALPSSQRKLMTLILRKLLASSTFAIAGTLEALAERLEDTIRSQISTIDLTEILQENFEEFIDYEDEYTDDDSVDTDETKYTKNEIEEMREEARLLREFYRLAESIRRNSKGEVLLTALERGFSETVNRGGKKKAIIFTESRRTQDYLHLILESTDYSGKIVLFNGSNNDEKSRTIYYSWLEKHKDTDKITGSRAADMRAAIVEYFRDEGEIMIATEAAAEGINLQFCSLVVNYDLPWNPQRIEQRIGRCHRYGQKHDVVVVNFLNRKNAADQRVYQLLSEKFKLFDGVFGASDEVLGVIESGVDFEKRIAEIYQQCRTEKEIKESFDLLQSELESQIDEKMYVARIKLLENFDEEVHERLKINLEQSKEYLNKYEQWLWQITKYFLEPYARFDGSENSFLLVKNPFSEEFINPGPYRLAKNVEDANTYRIGHPLAERIIDHFKKAELPTRELVFDYSGSEKKISILEDLVGKSGWLQAICLTISSFETEDHIILAGITEEGEILDTEQCRRMFSLPAYSNSSFVTMTDDATNNLNSIVAREGKNIMELISSRNSIFFEREMDKLDRWSEDVKTSLELELKDLDREIKFRKTESKKLINLEEKVAAQREIKELEKKRNVIRQDLFKAQDEVDCKKEALLGDIEAKLKIKLVRNNLFNAKWNIV